MKLNYSSLTVGITLAIIMTSVYIGYEILKPEPRLPIYAPSDINPKLVEPDLQKKSRNHRVKDFSFTNQLGETVTAKTFENSIYVTDFFFTTCPTICPKMTTQLKRVQHTYLDRPDFKLLSHTVTPEIDSMEVLLEYAELQGADHNKWHFVTGEKSEIYDMARTAYFAAEDPGLGDEHDFVHTENFVLVDKEKRIRGYYDGTSTEEVDKLIADIAILISEYEAK